MKLRRPQSTYDEAFNRLYSQVMRLVEDFLKRRRECKRCSSRFIASGPNSDTQVFCSHQCQLLFWREWRKTPTGRKQTRDYARVRRQRLKQGAK